MTNRWWIYQRERFPLMAHTPLIAAFSFSAICYSALVRHTNAFPNVRSLVVGFASSFLFFLQLRIADEFKDFEEDSRFRPYRPVPRGLIRLRDLAYLWAGCIAVQFGLALWLSPRLIPLLVITWTYLALMSKEFFLRTWLKKSPIVYMVSHMAIMPLVDLYTTACDWVAAGYRRPPDGLIYFLLVSFFNGMVVEIGRKIRAPEDEERGVETYSFLWGRRRAVSVWLSIMTLTASIAALAARGIGFTLPSALLFTTVIVTSTLVCTIFLRRPITTRGKWIETMAGVWSLLLYLTLGTIPLLLRWHRGQL